MRVPTPGEMQSAVNLLDRMALTDDARALLIQISLHEPVQMEALILLRSLADSLVEQEMGTGGKSKALLPRLLPG